MNSNKRINLLVDMVKLGLIILIACAMVSVIVFMVSDDPMTAITSFFIRQRRLCGSCVHELVLTLKKQGDCRLYMAKKSFPLWCQLHFFCVSDKEGVAQLLFQGFYRLAHSRL